MKQTEQLQCIVHSTLIVGMTIALFFLLGTCIVQIQSVWVNFACTKRPFNLVAKAIINVRNVGLCARCAKFVLKIKQNPFLVAWSRVYIFEASPKSFQDVIGDVYCPGKYCSNMKKCDSFVVNVTIPRTIYACGKCGTWLFVHNFFFMLQEHPKSTKTDKTRFFFARKRWTCYSTNNYCLMSHFNQPTI